MGILPEREGGTEHAGKEVVRLKRNSAKVGQNGRETELEEGCLCDYFIKRKSVRVTLLPGSILSLKALCILLCKSEMAEEPSFSLPHTPRR